VLHFRNGVRTEVAFEDGADEPAVLQWMGLDTQAGGMRLWLDLLALPAEVTTASAGGSRPAW
jgi:hypothetical protein